MTGQESADAALWRHFIRTQAAQLLAKELESYVRHSEERREEDASTGDLLEDLELRLETLAKRLRGEVTTAATWEPQHYHYPMAEEA